MNLESARPVPVGSDIDHGVEVRVSDVAPAVLFPLSDAARMITCEAIRVDAGQSI